jgi:hypothetical protein
VVVVCGVCGGGGGFFRGFKVTPLEHRLRRYDIKNSFTLPIMESITTACDEGIPIPVSDPESPVSGVFRYVPTIDYT